MGSASGCKFRLEPTHYGVMKVETLPVVPDALRSLLQHVQSAYQPQPSAPKRGRRPDFTERSWLLLAVVAVILRTFKDSELHRLLTKDERLRQQLGFCRVPDRTWIGRCLNRLVPAAEAQIAALGHLIRDEIKPAADECEASAIDGRMYEACGPKWHRGNRAEGLVPVGLRNVDTESQWSKSGYRQWVQGYRLVQQGLVFPAPVPIWAVWRPNNQAEAAIAQAAVAQKRLVITDVLLGDTAFGAPDFTAVYVEAEGWVLTPKDLNPDRHSWKDDLYAYRKETIELLFQRILQATDLKACQVRGEGRNGAFVLASVWLYQICFRINFQDEKPLALIKEHLENARWRLPT